MKTTTNFRRYTDDVTDEDYNLTYDISTFNYTYYPDGNVETVTDTRGNTTYSTNYVYDSANRLTTANITNGESVVRSWNYAYNNLGDRTSQSVTDADGTTTTTTYTYSKHRLVSEATGNNVTEYRYDENGKLVLDGNNSYFEFPEDIFTRRDTMTLSFDVLNNNTADSTMAFSLGSGDKYYFFYKVNSDTMRTAINVTSPVTTNAYTYEEKAISSTLGTLTNKWMHIDVVVDGYTMKVYMDGILVAENNDLATTISHIGLDSLEAYLGKSMYSADPYFTGSFDNVEVYYRALTPAEIAAANGNTDEDMAKLDAEAVNFGYDVNYVTGDITLPSEGVYGSTITWLETSDESVIDLDGNVSVPETGVKTVTLKAEFDYNGTKYTKEYTLLVKPVTSYLTSTLESKWQTYLIPVATGKVTYKFNLTASQAGIDAGVSFGDKDVTPTGYGHMPIYVRATSGGYFDAYNSNGYTKTETVTYEADKTYAFTIEADVTTKKYSVYVEVDGERKTIANNFTFRTSATCDDLGKIMVYAGSGVTTEGLLTVTDLEVILPAKIAFENVVLSGGKVTGNVVSEEDLTESIVIVASYNADNSLNSAKAVKLVDNAFEADAATENVKVMLWNSVSGMVPYLEAVVVE